MRRLTDVFAQLLLRPCGGNKPVVPRFPHQISLSLSLSQIPRRGIDGLWIYWQQRSGLVSRAKGNLDKDPFISSVSMASCTLNIVYVVLSWTATTWMLAAYISTKTPNPLPSTTSATPSPPSNKFTLFSPPKHQYQSLYHLLPLQRCKNHHSHYPQSKL